MIVVAIDVSILKRNLNFAINQFGINNYSRRFLLRFQIRQSIIFQ